MPPFDEEQLSHVTSHLSRFLLDPEGNAAGMVLANGVKVHFSAYLSSDVITAVHVGDSVTVYGTLPTNAPLIAAVMIEAADGSRIVDQPLGASREPTLGTSRRLDYCAMRT